MRASAKAPRLGCDEGGGELEALPKGGHACPPLRLELLRWEKLAFALKQEKQSEAHRTAAE